MPRPLLLLVPFVIVLALAVLRKLVRSWLRASRLARIASAGAPGELGRFLAVRDATVVEAAARRLVALTPAAELVARIPTLPGGFEVARALAEKDPELVLASLRAADRETRLLWAHAVAERDEGARALVAIAADPSAKENERAAAYAGIERSPPAVVREAALRALQERAEPTAELLWVLGTVGEPDDAVLAAPHVAATSYPLARAAVEAVQVLRARGAPTEGARVRELLAAGRQRLRSVHPEGDNPLADELVARIEQLEELLPEPRSAEVPR